MEVYEGAGEGSIPLSRVMDTNFFISPSLIIKQPRPPAAQYFWYYCKYSPQHSGRKGKKENYISNNSRWKEGRPAKDKKSHPKYDQGNEEYGKNM